MSHISFEQIDSWNLSSEQILDIFNIEQDMWARKEGLWEYVRCEDCKSVYSKQDIYNNLPSDKYSMTVSEIELEYNTSSILCLNCKSDTVHCFSPEEYIQDIRDRYNQKALLVVMKQQDTLVGFMDGYVSDFGTIYYKEFEEHYQDMGLEKLTEMIQWKLGEIIPEEVFSCTSMWTRESYMNFTNIYLLLQNFFKNFPQEYDNILGISEIRLGWSLDRLYSILWSQKVGTSEYSELIRTSDTYMSEIFLQENIWTTYKKGFSVWLRDFLRAARIQK